MSKLEALQALEAKILEDKSLPLQESRLVFGEGNVGAQVLFIGEAPGFHEDRLGRPFVGRGGQLLDQLLGEVGWQRANVYITNIVKRRPPENRDPLPEEIEAYKPYLAEQIEIIDPAVIITLGRFAMNYFLPLAKITRDQGRAFALGKRVVVPLFHPAAALRSTEVLKQFRESFHKLPAIVEGVLKGNYAPETSAPAATPKKPLKKPQSQLF